MSFAIVSRALLILSVAVGLQFSVWRLPIGLPFQWNYWVEANVVLLLMTPLLLSYVMLSDPPQEFGIRVGDWRFGLKWALASFAVTLPFLVIVSRLPYFQHIPQYYRVRYLPPMSTSADILLLSITTGVYMIAWEFFFRGYVLFGLKPAMGVGAVIVQAVMFMLGHIGKPMEEMPLSFLGGLALGALCFRTEAFWPAFVTHTLVHMTWNWLVLR